MFERKSCNTPIQHHHKTDKTCFTEHNHTLQTKHVTKNTIIHNRQNLFHRTQSYITDKTCFTEHKHTLQTKLVSHNTIIHYRQNLSHRTQSYITDKHVSHNTIIHYRQVCLTERKSCYNKHTNGMSLRSTTSYENTTEKTFFDA